MGDRGHLVFTRSITCQLFCQVFHTFNPYRNKGCFQNLEFWLMLHQFNQNFKDGISDLYFFKIDLLRKQSDGEWGRDRLFCSLPKWWQWPGLRQGSGTSGFLTWVTGAQGLGQSFAAFPGALIVLCTGGWAAEPQFGVLPNMGCQSCKQWPNLPHHNTGLLCVFI